MNLFSFFFLSMLAVRGVAQDSRKEGAKILERARSVCPKIFDRKPHPLN